jgi:hypothetical protein
VHVREHSLAVVIDGIVAASAGHGNRSFSAHIHDKEQDVEAGGVVQGVGDGDGSIDVSILTGDREVALAEVLGFIVDDAPVLLSDVVDLIEFSDDVLNIL